VYEKEEFRNTILCIINELTEEQRSAVMMYYFDELTVSQIAQIQDVSEGTVKSRLNYARKAIKKSVEDYEKKYDIKLHSFSFLPLFMLFFGKDLMPAAKVAEVQVAVSSAAATVTAAGASATIAAEGVAVATATAATATSEAVAVTGGIAAKIAAMPILSKIIIGVSTVAVVVGAGIAGVQMANTSEPPETAPQKEDVVCDCVDVDANGLCDYCNAELDLSETEDVIKEPTHKDEFGDGLCDHCSEAMCTLGLAEHLIPNARCSCEICGYGTHTEGDAHPFCGSCRERWPIDDKNSDGACDTCGEYSCGGPYHSGTHVDADEDERCDVCMKYMCGLIWGLDHYVNYDDGIYDGKCDKCGLSIGGAMGYGGDERPHADENIDGVCDCCGNYICNIYTMPEFGGVDADEDGKCDICKFYLCDAHGTSVYHYDFDSDEKCDRCDHFICAHGFLPHTNENADGICEKCLSHIN